MSKALSVDLRDRVVAAVRDEGLSHRAAAIRFKVSAASISRWRALQRQSGHLRPGPLGGDRRSAASEAHAKLILRIFETQRDMSIEELRARLAGRGLHYGYGTLWRFFVRHNLTRKKDRVRRRAGPSRRPETTSGLVRRPDRSRSRQAGLRGRELG
jgi:transposase